ncbi:unnamed protein product [Closterium sp. NIES-54]
MVGTIACASPSKETSNSLAPEAGEDFQAVAAAVHANPSVVLLDSGCSHHLMGDRNAFVSMQDRGDVSHVHGFNGAVQPVRGRGTVALEGEGGKRILVSDVLYVPGVQANLLSTGQLKDCGVKMEEADDETVLLSTNGTVFAHARYTGQVLCTTLRPFVPRNSDPVETVALWAIVSSIRDSVDKWHARLAHVGIDTIKKTAAHGAATGLEITSPSGANLQCVSCVGGKLVRHTFPEEGKEAANVLDVVHVDVCGSFRVAAKDGSRYFLLLKDRKTRFVWTYPLERKSDALKRFRKWLPMVDRHCNAKVKTLRSDRGGEFLGHEFTEFLDTCGIIYDLTCPYTPQQNGMAEREMRTVVESVRTMLLHMGVQHHWWHLALRQAVWIRNCLERASLPPGTTPYKLVYADKPDLTLARVWGYMV